MTPELASAPGDRELLDAAARLLTARYAPGRHVVAAAIAAADGSRHLGLHLAATVARSSVCAEAVALGAALTAAATTCTTLVTVHHTEAEPGWRPVAPCGSCRELLRHQAPGLRILVLDDAGDTVEALRSVTIESLLPVPFTRD